jgi:hypothetical protein
MKSHFCTLLMMLGMITVFAQKKADQVCKAMLQVDPIIETIEKTHYIFTGADTTGLNVKVTTITIMEPRREMVKRRDKNCTSPNIEDCYISTYEDIPAVTMNLYTLPGPDATHEYDTRKEKVKVTKREAGSQETHIVCEKNRSKALIKKVQTALVGLGYPLTIDGNYDQATALSVTDFQKGKQLAYGDLTLETLAALNVK